MPNILQLEFPNADKQPAMIAELSLHQERYKHEYAVAKFRDWDMQYSDIRPGTPVKFTLTGDYTSRDFVGYIHHVAPHITPGQHVTEVHLIGASYQLKNQSQQVYINKTADQIVTEIAKRNNFAYHCEPHPRVFPQVSQAGMSDMELMHKLAKQCGYTLKLVNSEIHFKSVLSAFNELKQSAEKFILRDANHPLGSTIYSFKPHIGESLDQEGEHKAATAISGVDRITGELIQVTNQKRPNATKQRFEPEYFDRFHSVAVASDPQTAKYEAQAADERTKFAYRATAEVLGTAHIEPDHPVFLDGLNEDYHGYWTVLKTEHKVISKAYSTQVYTTILHLGTDSLGRAANSPGSAYVSEPSNTPQRIIVPGVRQTNKKAVNVLKPGIKTGSKNKGIVGFGKINNRKKPLVANKVVVAKTWASPSGNLKTVSKTFGRSPAVVNRLRSKGALN